MNPDTKPISEEALVEPENDQQEPPPLTFRQAERQLHSTESIEPADFLRLFPNDIAPTTIIGVEERSDGTVVVHCSNAYEYLRFGFREDPAEVGKIEEYRSILEAFSTPETLVEAMRLVNELPEDAQRWVMEKLNAAGSAVPVDFNDGRRESIVMMNDMPTRRMYNRDGTRRDEDQLRAYDEGYQRTVEHEVRHTQYFRKFGKNLEAWRKVLEGIRPLSHNEQKKYHMDRYTKDEIVAHMENEVTMAVAQNGQKQTEVNWVDIIQNLQKDDYCPHSVFLSDDDRVEYRTVLMELVRTAEEVYIKTRSIDAVMDSIVRIDITGLTSIH